jgi:NADPH:quinone reductase-like Zn-dependent oxidoreductase
MKAAVLQECGAPPRYLDHPDPILEAGQALVRMIAAPITPLDVLCASGTSYWGQPQLPYVPGVQGVGEILEGDSLSAGSLIWFPTTAGITPGDGSMAELVSIDEMSIVALPPGLSPVAAASLGLSAVAALLSCWELAAQSDSRRCSSPAISARGEWSEWSTPQRVGVEPSQKARTPSSTRRRPTAPMRWRRSFARHAKTGQTW